MFQRKGPFIILFATCVLGALSCSSTVEVPPVKVEMPPVKLDQGWTSEEQQTFYTRDQGSRIMPLRWMQALKQTSGDSFLASSLSRYGFLPNEKSGAPGLPVGFTVAPMEGEQYVGMTCAACHTRQIEVAGTAYRIDGGPAITDIQGFLAGLDQAVGTVLSDSAAFQKSFFAQTVLGVSASPDQAAQLFTKVKNWHAPYDTLMQRALPQEPWGWGRLDAVGMIFNRLTGLDIGPPPSYMIPKNIKSADAPVRYPFLWNASKQDKTQWLGFAPNGSPRLGLGRNLGEVYGVFGVFRPEKKKWTRPVLRVDYLHDNSANFAGLKELETLVDKLSPPKWPWKVDQNLVVTGAQVFKRECAGCHIDMAGKSQGHHKTWRTLVLDVGTDIKADSILSWKVDTGVLRGAKIPFKTKHLESQDMAPKVLTTAVIGTVVQHIARDLRKKVGGVFLATESTGQKVVDEAENDSLTEVAEQQALDELEAEGMGAMGEELEEAPRLNLLAQPVSATAGAKYEARVLKGIWAAAPYLHNGSVPTLADLLNPVVAKQPNQDIRPSEFKVGAEYDTVNVGLSAVQKKFNYTLKTTDCGNRGSGNSRCGHEYGTTLDSLKKKELLEYLKTL